ncbi:MAG TPA: Rieske 2Fe-2S domain-containing protein [Pirellulales bacterium]|jgi:Rieske Fe-S protein|nr:Rieske 2Fe-2S domain-containing protein [Pirellulales bacterium]
MNRRIALKWFTRILGLACALVVAVPGASFVIATVRRTKGDGPLVRRVARLQDLVPGRPFEAPILASWRDAWIVHPEQPIGRVWLVRRTDEHTPPANSQVEVYSAVCPHMGCIVGWVPADKRFFCPCHKGAFNLSGEPIPSDQLGWQNPVPRPLDKLACHLVEEKSADSSTWWVEVTYELFEQGATTQIAKT